MSDTRLLLSSSRFKLRILKIALAATRRLRGPTGAKRQITIIFDGVVVTGSSYMHLEPPKVNVYGSRNIYGVCIFNAFAWY